MRRNKNTPLVVHPIFRFRGKACIKFIVIVGAKGHLPVLVVSAGKDNGSWKLAK